MLTRCVIIMSTIFTATALAFLVSCSDGTFSAGTVGGAVEETQGGLTLQVAGVTTEIEDATLELAASALRQAALTSVFDPRLQQEHALKMKKAPIEFKTGDCTVFLIRDGVATEIDYEINDSREEGGMVLMDIELDRDLSLIPRDNIEFSCLTPQTEGALQLGGIFLYQSGDDLSSGIQAVFDSDIDLCRRIARKLLLGEGFDEYFKFVNLGLLMYPLCLDPSFGTFEVEAAVLADAVGSPPDPLLNEAVSNIAKGMLVRQVQMRKQLTAELGGIEEAATVMGIMDGAWKIFNACVYVQGLAGRAQCLEDFAANIVQLAEENGLSQDSLAGSWKKVRGVEETELQLIKGGKTSTTFNLYEKKWFSGSKLFDTRIQMDNATRILGGDKGEWTSLISRIKGTIDFVVDPNTVRALFDDGGVFGGQTNELLNNALLGSPLLGMPITIFDGAARNLSTDSTCEEIEQEVGVSLGEAGCVVARQRIGWKSRVDALGCDVTSTGYCDLSDLEVLANADFTPTGEYLTAMASFSGKTMAEFFGTDDVDFNTLNGTNISAMSASMLGAARSSLKSSGTNKTIQDTDGDGCPDVMELAKGLNPYSTGDCDPKEDTFTDADFTAFENLLGTGTTATTTTAVSAKVYCLPQSSLCTARSYNISCTGPRLVTSFMSADKVGTASDSDPGEGITVVALVPDSAPYTCACVASGALESACTGSITASVTGEGTTFKAVVVDPASSSFRLADSAGKKLFLSCDTSVTVGKNSSCKIYGSCTPSGIKFGGIDTTFTWSTGSSDLSVCIPKGLGSQSFAAVTCSDGSTVASNPVKVNPEPSGNISCYPTATAVTPAVVTPTVTPAVTPTVVEPAVVIPPPAVTPPVLSAITISPSALVRGVTEATLTASPAGTFRAVQGTSTVTCTHSNGQTLLIPVTTWGADRILFTCSANLPQGSCVFNVTVGGVTKSSSPVTITAPPVPITPFTVSAPSSITKGQVYTITATSGNFAPPDGGTRELKWTNVATNVSSAALLNVIWSAASLTHTIPLMAQPASGTTVTFTVTIKDSSGTTVRSATSGNVTVN